MKCFSDILKLFKAALLLMCMALVFHILSFSITNAQEKNTDKPAYDSAKEYYKAQSALKVQDDVVKIIQDKNLKQVADYLERLRAYANGNHIPYSGDFYERAIENLNKEERTGTNARAWDNYDDAEGWFRWTVDSEVEDINQLLKSSLSRAIEKNAITKEELQLIENEASRLLLSGASRAKEAARAEGKSEEFVSEIDRGTAKALDPENSVSSGLCPETKFLRAKYQSGCWSCLVVEKLSSSFLTAAKSAYGLSQRAGITLLWIGAVMWLLMWALKNVSSLAQVEPGNILNELIKFLFKVGLAYWFIMGGLPMVKNYFIGPIMGFGASVAQQYWPERFEGQVEDFDWAEWSDEDWKRINEAADKAEAEQDKLLQQEKEEKKEATPIIEGADQISDINANTVAEAQKNKTGSSTLNGKVPDFSLPGTTGTLTSAFGCRPRPKTSCNGRNNRCGGCTGSNYHNGVDIGAPNGTPVYAIGSGKITYATDSSCGNFARITHDGGSGTWVSIYCHMLPKSDNYAITYNRATKQKTGKDIQIDRVAKFQQIGFVGNTGASGGNHLHLGIRYNGANVNPLMLASGVIQAGNPKTCPNCPTESDRTPTPSGFKRGATKFGSNGMIIGSDLAAGAGGYAIDGSKIYSPEDSSLIIKVENIKYTGPTDIIPESVMNSILGATKAITDITAENMILGDAIMCYSTMERGGAWKLADNWWFELYITNAFMWIEGFIIFCFGMLLTLAIVYYLMDMSFKLGFAVIALPIVVGLWPFNITKGKLSVCISIMAKAAATFAFLALTTTYTVALTEAVINWGDSPEDVAAGRGGISRLYTVMDASGSLDNMGTDAGDYRESNQDDLDYAASKLSLFSTTFMLLLFAFLYSFKLVQNTVPDLVDKFFPDKAFGQTNPMHQWATAASRWVKDQAMKPVGYARDIALNKAGEALKGMPKSAVGFAKSMAGKGSGNSKTLAGRGMRGAGALTGFAGRAMSAVGLKNIGGKVQSAGQKMKDAGNATDKAYNDFGTRNKKSENDKDK